MRFLRAMFIVTIDVWKNFFHGRSRFALVGLILIAVYTLVEAVRIDVAAGVFICFFGWVIFVPFMIYVVEKSAELKALEKK